MDADCWFVLTPEGEKLYTHVAVAYAQLREAENELVGFGKLSTGTVRIGATETALYGFLIDVLAKFRELHPGINFFITNSTTMGAAVMLKKGLLDLAVVTSPVDVPSGIREYILSRFPKFFLHPKQVNMQKGNG